MDIMRSFASVESIENAIKNSRTINGKHPNRIYANINTLTSIVKRYGDPTPLERFPLPNGLTANYVGVDICQDENMLDNTVRCE